MSTENIEWLVFNALHGDVSGEIPDHLRRMIKAKDELATIHSDYAALLTRHNALVEAVKKLTKADDDLQDAWDQKRANEMQKTYSKARSEVDRLIAQAGEGEGKV